MKRNLLLAVVMLLALSLCAQADVRHESVVEYKFSGTLGTVMKVFGLSKPIHTVDYYKGDIKRSDVLDKKGRVRTSVIIDLENELFISVDHKKKRYTQMSFDEWRRNMRETMQEIEELEAEQEEDQNEYEREYSYDFDIQVADEPEEVHGFQANKMTMTVDVYSREKGSDEDPVKEMTIISEHWLSPELDGNDEIQAFNMKLMKKLAMDPEEAEMASMFEQLSQTNPQLAEAMKRMEDEETKLDGVPIKTVMVFEAYKPESEEEPEEESGGGGLFGGLRKKATKKVLGDGGEDSGKVLELKSDILEHSTSAIDSESFAVPEKYKLKN
jgi:hypothetical protein